MYFEYIERISDTAKSDLLDIEYLTCDILYAGQSVTTVTDTLYQLGSTDSHDKQIPSDSHR